MEGYRRPNRSDVHLSKEEEAKIEETTRDYFDGVVPKRHTKPQRSDYAAAYADAFADDNSGGEIPELAEFQRLEHDPQTGTGFIKVGSMKGNSFSLAPDTVMDSHASCKGNPATNDWIPAAADSVTFISDKPRRSDI